MRGNIACLAAISIVVLKYWINEFWIWNEIFKYIYNEIYFREPICTDYKFDYKMINSVVQINIINLINILIK
jgi:hypothetical protein